MESPTDAELIARVRAGDRDALEGLLRRHADRIFRFGMRMCRDSDDAQEVLQETMLAVTKSADHYRGDASFASWLFTLVRNACARTRRKRVGEPDAVEPLDDVAPTASGPDPDADLQRKQLADALEAAIGELEPMYREVLLLRDVEGLSAKETAATLELTVAAVKSRLHRARLQLREKLAPTFSPTPPVADPEACPDVLSSLSAHLEGDLDAEHCRTLEEHVAECPRCNARCDTLRQTLKLCATSPGPRVPPAVVAAVRAEIEKAREKV